ncbi:hypothetical protein [Cryptosporangium japonicum]|uniref:Uncharacterized protein n=1 Tax=Cryptosporangium japonicum TaxID=80872 RepID=A0ABP3D3U3_9ACTN
MTYPMHATAGALLVRGQAEVGLVPARPEIPEPAHFHLDFGYSFTTRRGDIGRFQESELSGAGWYRLAEAEALVGPRVARAR